MIIEFFRHINTSCQVGDIAYASYHSSRQSGRNHPGSSVDTKPFVLGRITNINRITGSIEVDPNADGGVGNTAAASLVLSQLYIFFQKSQLANTSGVIGYFLETEYRNYSTLPAEMFATAADYVESSK